MYGKPEITNTTIKCEECGKYFRNLGQHIIFKHNLSALKYKYKWGYCRSQPLECLETTKIRNKNVKKNGTIKNLLQDNGHRFKKGHKTWHRFGIPLQAILKMCENISKTESHKKHKLSII